VVELGSWGMSVELGSWCRSCGVVELE
jgi:hypothetical protein